MLHDKDKNEKVVKMRREQGVPMATSKVVNALRSIANGIEAGRYQYGETATVVYGKYIFHYCPSGNQVESALWDLQISVHRLMNQATTEDFD